MWYNSKMPMSLTPITYGIQKQHFKSELSILDMTSIPILFA